jgi:N-acetylglucosaminyl-diphospho-decaprenol L-rhamnosyltransferase
VKSDLRVPIAVCVVSYNARELLRACLHTVRSEPWQELVVVDNASMDASAEMVERSFPEALLLRNSTNSGYGAAANQAVAQCAAPYVLLLNCDAEVQHGAVAALAQYLDEHPRAGAVGPRLLKPDGSLHPSCFPFPSPLDFFLDVSNLYRLIGRIPLLADRFLRTWPHTVSRRVPWVCGAAVAIRRQAFDAIGGFDEGFFMYSEDVDLAYRLARAGWQVHFAPVATVVHYGGGSTRHQRTEMLVQLYASLTRFYQLHYSRARRFQFQWLVTSVALARLVRDWSLLRLPGDPHWRALRQDQLSAWQRLLRREWTSRVHV